MHFGYYESYALEVAVDLVNTRSETTSEDSIAGADGLTAFLTEHAAGLDTPVAALYRDALARWAPSDADARALRGLRARLRSVFDTAGVDVPATVGVLNDELRAHRALPRISDQHGTPHLHFEAAQDGAVHWLAVTALMGLVLFVCDGNAHRLGICASATCRRAFIDRSKNGSKSYCSDTCAHRESVAAFRTRQRARRSPGVTFGGAAPSEGCDN